MRRIAFAVLLLATVATAHVPDHMALSYIGATGGYLMLAKVCRVEPVAASRLAICGMAAVSVAWEVEGMRRGVAFGWPDIAANALGLIAAGMVMRWMR